MSNEQVQTDEMSTEDVKAVNADEAQTTEVETEETEAANTNSPDVENEEVEETIEAKAERLQKSRDAMQAKIDRQTAAFSAQQKKMQEQAKQIAEFQAKLAGQEPAKEPVIDDYDTAEEFWEAKAQHKAEQLMADKQKEFAEMQKQQAQQALMNERLAMRQSQEAEYLQINPSYNSSVKEVDTFIQTLDVKPEVAEAFLTQMYKGNVPQVIDYFGANSGENLGELQTISQMTPVEAAVEVYKLQEKLKAPKKKETKAAPKPVSSPKGGGKAKKDLKDGDVLKNLGLK